MFFLFIFWIIRYSFLQFGSFTLFFCASIFSAQFYQLRNRSPFMIKQFYFQLSAIHIKKQYLYDTIFMLRFAFELQLRYVYLSARNTREHYLFLFNKFAKQQDEMILTALQAKWNVFIITKLNG